MEVYEAAEVALQIQDRIDTLWMLFLSINSTIIAGVVLVQRTFSVLEKSVAIVIYLVVTLINYLTLSNSIQMLRAVYFDMLKFAFTPDQPGYEIVRQIGEFTQGNFINNNLVIIPIIYICAAILSIGAIIFDEKITKTRVEL